MNRLHGLCPRRVWASLARRGTRCLATAAAVAALAAAMAWPSIGPGGSGIGNFGLTPAPNGQGHVAAYFSLTVPAGRSTTSTVVVSNLAGTSVKLRIGRSSGVTAANSGSAYSPILRGCSGPACWVTGLPSVITLPARTKEWLNFRVHVPARTIPGQYLSGITAYPAAKPRSVRFGTNGKAKAQAIILEQVTVGVAVTVGKLSTLATVFRIPGVQGAIEGPVARLNIQLENTGQTFAHGTGKASCTAGSKQHSYTVYADTILPHQHALIAVNAPGLPEGATVPCRIHIHYGNHQTVSWAGMVAIPSPSGNRTIHTGPGAYSSIPAAGVPGWAIALISVGGLILAGIGVLLWRLR